MIKCEKCGEVLDPKKAVWLDLSNTDGNYYVELPKGHISQGAFSFGIECAKKQVLSSFSKKVVIDTTMIRFGMWLEANSWEFYDSTDRCIYVPTKEVQLTVDLFAEFKKENEDL